MAIIWQSSWFWVLLSAVIFILLSGFILRIHTPQTQTENNYRVMPTPTLFTNYIPPDILQPYTLPLQLTIDQDHRRTPSFYDDILINSPTCYGLASGEYSCLGQIDNNSTRAIGDTIIDLRLFDGEGQKLSYDSVAIEQRLILSGASATYRASFRPLNDLNNNEENSASIFVDSARINTNIDRIFPPASNIQTLRIFDVRESIIENGRYNISLSIENNSGYVAQDIRLFTTLENTEWGIVGYDVHEVEDNMQTGTIRQIQLEIIPHVITQELNASFHAEATVDH